eukprot:COSAG04_NODE_11417_length_710_cov_1.062193_2_plen_57_part_01
MANESVLGAAKHWGKKKAALRHTLRMRCTPKLLWTGPCRHTATRQRVWNAEQRCGGG